MFEWLKKGGRKERGWKFWLKLIVGLHLLMGLVSFIVYHLTKGNL